ncbi:MAG: PorV/PorQ family protein [Ferruginibacter sp.]
MRRNLASSLLVILFFPLIGFSQFRKYSNEFLNIGAGARGLAMGNSQVASVKDATAGYWNPAGLTGVKDNINVSAMHADYFAGIAKYEYASVAVPVQDNKRTLGFSFLRFAVDDIPNTLYLVQPDGSVNYNNIETFSSADYAFLLSFAQTIKETEKKKISFGVNAKIIYRKVGHFATAWGFGIDAGVQVQMDRLHLGLVVRDLTTTYNAWAFKFTEREKQVLYLTNNDIPIKSTELTAPRIVLGAGYNFRISKSLNLLAEANADLTFDGKRNTIVSSNAVSVDPHLGLEAGIKDVFFVRAGITNFQQALADEDTLNQKKVWIYQPSLGAGFKIKNFSFDYAFTNLANQNNPLYTHVFSIRFNIVNAKKNKQ